MVSPTISYRLCSASCIRHKKLFCRIPLCFLFGILFPVIAFHSLKAQELQAQVRVIHDRIKGVDDATFQRFQADVTSFLNDRKWTSDNYLPYERIQCNFVFNFTQYAGDNIFSVQLTVQSSRPVYNTNYQSPVFNYLDQNVSFRYIINQPLEFNENRISGNDALQANLTAVLAYYVYIILGLDADSFSPRGGVPYFQKAQYIVNNAPEDSRYISGWKPFEGNRNRYWLVDNLLNNRLQIFHSVMYQYYRLGLDRMYDDPVNARMSILTSLSSLYTMNQENPNTMILQLFMLAKADELANLFSDAPLNDKQRALQILTQLDPEHTSLYTQKLQ
ncbi:uncharacterized protein DUF4835 [Thermoflavifilum aggregans]|uniref:Uncharacterized protein DUF4835 n=1 Tax=Thermoflavifilum aggregans TaxID=454188 RepID=A0A2M9CTN8_9BACT|nr:uncharacterized protein DUF4835 [Thermoflavifilum aggregans]